MHGCFTLIIAASTGSSCFVKIGQAFFSIKVWVLVNINPKGEIPVKMLRCGTNEPSKKKITAINVFM